MSVSLSLVASDITVDNWKQRTHKLDLDSSFYGSCLPYSFFGPRSREVLVNFFDFDEELLTDLSLPREQLHLLFLRKKSYLKELVLPIFLYECDEGCYVNDQKYIGVIRFIIGCAFFVNLCLEDPILTLDFKQDFYTLFQNIFYDSVVSNIQVLTIYSNYETNALNVESDTNLMYVRFDKSRYLENLFKFCCFCYDSDNIKQQFKKVHTYFRLDLREFVIQSYFSGLFLQWPEFLKLVHFALLSNVEISSFNCFARNLLCAQQSNKIITDDMCDLICRINFEGKYKHLVRFVLNQLTLYLAIHFHNTENRFFHEQDPVRPENELVHDCFMLAKHMVDVLESLAPCRCKEPSQCHHPAFLHPFYHSSRYLHYYDRDLPAENMEDGVIFTPFHGRIPNWESGAPFVWVGGHVESKGLGKLMKGFVETLEYVYCADYYCILNSSVENLQYLASNEISSFFDSEHRCLLCNFEFSDDNQEDDPLASRERVVLSCGHTFCLSCLTFLQNAPDGYSVLTDSEFDSWQCPLCFEQMIDEEGIITYERFEEQEDDFDDIDFEAPPEPDAFEEPEDEEEPTKTEKIDDDLKCSVDNSKEYSESEIIEIELTTDMADDRVVYVEWFRNLDGVFKRISFSKVTMTDEICFDQYLCKNSDVGIQLTLCIALETAPDNTIYTFDFKPIVAVTPKFKHEFKCEKFFHKPVVFSYMYEGGVEGEHIFEWTAKHEVFGSRSIKCYRPKYQPTVDDVGWRIQLEATPVGENGTTGESIVLTTDILELPPMYIRPIESAIKKGTVSFKVLVQNNIELEDETVSIRFTDAVALEMSSGHTPVTIPFDESLRFERDRKKTDMCALYYENELIAKFQSLDRRQPPSLIILTFRRFLSSFLGLEKRGVPTYENFQYQKK
ncbi:hypothetical protein PCE1_001834 [Barthelona sp. PCE]